MKHYPIALWRLMDYKSKNFRIMPQDADTTNKFKVLKTFREYACQLFEEKSLDDILKVMPELRAVEDLSHLVIGPTVYKKPNLQFKLSQLQEIIKRLPSEDGLFINREIPNILRESFCNSIRSKKASGATESQERYIVDAEQQIGELTRKLDECKKQLQKKKKGSLGINFFYIIVLLLISTVCGYIVWSGWAEKPEITIEYNVGEIIGGLLAGGGIAVAGAAYAKKALSND